MMPRTIHLAPSVLVVFLAPLYACEPDPSPSSSPNVPEGGSPTVEGGGGNPDGGTTDTGTPSKTGVTLTVKKAGAPLGNIRVVFGDTSGSVKGEAKTDASGVVTTDGTTRYMTVVLGPDGEAVPSLVTYTDVEDGDELLVDIPVKPATGSTPTPLGSFSVSFPQVENATNYDVQVGNCTDGNSDGSTVTWPIYSYCTNAGKAPLVGLVKASGFGPNNMKYATRPDALAPTGGATAAQPAFGESEFQDPVVSLVRLVDADEGTLVAANVDVIRHAVTFPPGARSGSGGSGGEEFLLAPIGETLIASVTFEESPGSIDSVRHMYRRRESPGGPGTAITGNVPFDFSKADSIASIKTATIAEADAGRPELSFSVDSPNPSEVALAQTAWFGGGKGGLWTVISNPKNNGWKAPALPADLAPPSGATYAIAAFALVTSSFYEGHKEAKKTAFDFSASRFIYDRALPKEGTVAFTLHGEFYAPK
ncbi:MAG TPA: hypothetical protein VM925_13625 [Labilithrix sp.]|nr:hypothetical protein [Labilithrix sp.]